MMFPSHDLGEGIQEQSQQSKDVNPVNDKQCNAIVDLLASLERTESDLCKFAPNLLGCEISSIGDLTSEQAVKVISFLENYNA